jgi:microcystin-dependent protein
MATPINPVITDAGLAAAIAANGAGLQLQITHVALGAGAYAPATTATALVDRREKAAVFNGARVGNQLTISVTHRASDYTGAAYGVGEIGFYAGDPDSGGVLFAVWSAVGRSSPNRGGSNAINYQQTYTITLSAVPTGSVTVVYDTAAAIAMASITAHLQAADPHTQYILKAGNVGSPMTGPLLLSGTATLPTQAVPLQQLLSDGCPVGMIADFMGRTPRAGWLELNGVELLRVNYPDLWDYAQAQTLVVTHAQWLLDRSRFSQGDGSTTFRIPDFRGEFRRSWDNGRNIDAGRDIATIQIESIGTHGHAINGDNTNGWIAGSNPPTSVQLSDRSVSGTYNLIVPSAEGETRPRNISVLTCIKAGTTGTPTAPPLPPGPPAPPPAPSPTPVGLPVAAFSANPLFDFAATIGALVPVSFTDQSTGSPTSWLWTFGDGATSTAQNPTHSYAAAGVADRYTVTLTVTNSAGPNTVTKTDYITISLNDQNP